MSLGGMVAPLPSGSRAGCEGLSEPSQLCVSTVLIVLGVPHCPLELLGTIMWDDECDRVLCGVGELSAFSFPMGSVLGAVLMAGAVLSSMVTAVSTLAGLPPGGVGDVPSLPAAASVVPAEGEGCAAVLTPSRTAGTVPASPGLLLVPEGSAVPGGVPGKGNSSASVCSHPAPCCGSAGRGRGMLSGAGALRHSTNTRAHPAGKKPIRGTVPVRQPSPGWAQGTAVPRVEPIPLPRAGQSRAQHPTRTAEGTDRASAPSTGLSASSPPKAPAGGDGAAEIRPSRTAASRPRRLRPHTGTSPRRRQKAPHVQARSRPSPAERRGAEPRRAARRVKRFPSFARGSRGAAAGVGPFVPRESFPAKGKARASLGARLDPAAFVSARGTQPLPLPALRCAAPRTPDGRDGAPLRADEGTARPGAPPSPPPRDAGTGTRARTPPLHGGDAHPPGKTGPRPPSPSVRPGRSRGAPGAAGSPDPLPPHVAAPS